MKQKTKSLGAALLLLALLAGLLPSSVLAAQGDTPVVTGYQLTSGGKGLASFSKGTTLTVTLTIKDAGMTAEKVGGDANLDASRLVDSFSGGTVTEKKITSGGGDALTYTLTVSSLVYTGTGRALRLFVGYKGQSNPYSSLEIPISEAVEYEAPKPSDPPPSPAPEPSPAPMVLIRRTENGESISAGQEVSLTVIFDNLSGMTLRSPVATFTPSDALILSGGATSFSLPDIEAKKVQRLTIKVKAVGTISSPVQSIGVELKYNYNNHVSFVQGTTSDKLSLPAVVKSESKVVIPPPPVIVTRSAVSGPITSGQTLDMTIQIKNAGKTPLLTPVVTLSTSDALMLQSDTSTFVLSDLPPDQVQTIPIKVQAAKEIASSTQSITADLKYSYNAGDAGVTQASTSERITLASAVTTNTPQKDPSVPNLIIRRFGFGGDSVSAGQRFPLSFTVQNTGKLTVENIVATVESGESFAMDNSTNVFYYASLAPGGSLTQDVPMQALPTAKTGAQTVTISFKYEYSEGQKRASTTSETKLSIPVFQNNRFQVIPPVVPEAVFAGEEISLTANYVNKGKSEVSNVEATIEGAVESPSKTQYLGNFEAGKSGTIGFVFTPSEPGETVVTLKISYEDANQKVQTLSFPLTLNVQESAPVGDAGGEVPMEEEPQQNKGKIILFCVLGLGGGAAAVIALLRRHKKKHAHQKADANWDSWEEEETPAPETEDPSSREE